MIALEKKKMLETCANVGIDCQYACGTNSRERDRKSGDRTID